MQIVERPTRNDPHPLFKRSWVQPKPSRQMILAELKAQVQVCEVHLRTLRELLTEACADE